MKRLFDGMRLAERARALTLLLISSISCGGEADCPAGAERCDCRPHAACDAGLQCRSNLCVRDDGAGGNGGSSGASTPGSSAASGSAGVDSPVPGEPANVKFCSEVRVDGEQATLRLTVLDLAFDAFTLTCSPCQEVPTGVVLDYELLLMPDAISIAGFEQVIAPGEHMFLATIEAGELAMGFGTGEPGSRCEFLDPF